MPTSSPSRRKFLRGISVALGLPFLESALPKAVRAALPRDYRPPVRAAFLHFPNGMWEADWTPPDTGKNYTLSPTLQPLASVRDDVLVVTGLDKQHSRQGDGHYAKTANFLTGMPVLKTTGKDISAGGVSVDQLMAKHVGQGTPLPSLVLGVHRVMTGVCRSVGYTHAYGSYLSWESVTRPVTPESNPRIVYERLFGRSLASTARESRAWQNLLDLVLDDARTLRRQLGRDDQPKMDEYLDSVREIESRIEFDARSRAAGWQPQVTLEEIEAARPRAFSNFREHISVMLDLLVMAFRADATRVCSLMLASGISTESFSFLDGVRGGHHELSHHQNDPQKIAQYQKINQWYVQRFAEFLEQLRGISEHDGTLLDNCMVMFGSGMSDGNRHDADNLPILVGGRAGGALETGQHIAASNGSVPLCNLYLSMLNRMGIPEKSFGDSTGQLL